MCNAVAYHRLQVRSIAIEKRTPASPPSAQSWAPVASYRAVVVGYACLGGVLLLMMRAVSPAIEARRTAAGSGPRSVLARFSGLHRSHAVVMRLAKALHQAEGKPSAQLTETTAKNTLAAATPSMLHPGVLAYYRQTGLAR